MDILEIDFNVKEEELIDFITDKTKLHKSAVLKVELPTKEKMLGHLRINTVHALVKIFG